MSFLHRTPISKLNITTCIAMCLFSLILGGCNFLKNISEESEDGSFALPSFDNNSYDSNSYDNNDNIRAAVQSSKNIYKLVDPRTMMQILQYKHPDGWFAGGKADWVPQNPAIPHFYYTFAVSPDATMQFAMSSAIQLLGQGRIDQDPLLQPNTFAEKLILPSTSKDYNLSNVKIVDARYEQSADSMQRQQNAQQAMAAQGLRATEIRCLDYKLKVKGTRDGKEFFVIYLMPINIIEMQPARSFTHLTEVISAVSYGGLVGKEAEIEKITEAAVSSVEINPNFMAYRNQVAQELTQESIAEANRKFDIIRQRHIQNMRDSDERMARWQQESDRKHAQVMGRSGSGSSGSMLDKWDEYIKDVDRVDNPNGGDMYIDNRYDHAWINSDNEVMYMDSGSFNPNENAAFNNREWKRVR